MPRQQRHTFTEGTDFLNEWNSMEFQQKSLYTTLFPTLLDFLSLEDILGRFFSFSGHFQASLNILIFRKFSSVPYKALCNPQSSKNKTFFEVCYRDIWWKNLTQTGVRVLVVVVVCYLVSITIYFAAEILTCLLMGCWPPPSDNRTSIKCPF